MNQKLNINSTHIYVLSHIGASLDARAPSLTSISLFPFNWRKPKSQSNFSYLDTTTHKKSFVISIKLFGLKNNAFGQTLRLAKCNI